MQKILQYVVLVDATYPDEWRVEALDPFEGTAYCAFFTGPYAAERAREYAAFKSGQREPTGPYHRLLMEPECRDRLD